MKCKFCNKEYKGRSSERNLKKHLVHCNLNPNGIKYKCEKCGSEFDKWHGLIGHKASCGKDRKEKVKIGFTRTDAYFEKFNWKEIQEFYNNGNFWNDIIEKFNISNTGLNQAVKKGLIKTRSRSESAKLYASKNKFHHTEETKKKISDHRKKYLLEHPDKVPYLLNHSSKESYPEKYFTKLFEMENIKVEKSFRIGLYELDFAIPEKKIDIEIDGSQHYLDKKIVESDKNRNKFLEDNGWDIIRINWSKYQSMNYEEKHKFISKFKDYVNKIILEKPTIDFIRLRKGHDLCECGNEKCKTSNKCMFCRKNNSNMKCKFKGKLKDLCECGNEKQMVSNHCVKCASKKSAFKNRRVERPPLEQLLNEIEKLGYCETGRKYGVSDVSIRKWLKHY